jgi:glyoxylase-like metal-dependent hydrolase (beta-lactamase superfamily II)
VKVLTLPVGQLQTNCYLVSTHQLSVIIDPGDAADFVAQKIAEFDLKPQAILATHGHFDHLGAVNELKLAFKIPFLMHPKDEVLLKWFRKSTLHFTKVDPGPAPTIDKYLGTKYLDFKVIPTPGHTPGSVSLHLQEEKIIFGGDLIFKGGGVGRYDLPYADKNTLQKSIEKILKLPAETMVYPGHGESFTIGEFKEDYFNSKITVTDL